MNNETLTYKHEIWIAEILIASSFWINSLYIYLNQVVVRKYLVVVISPKKTEFTPDSHVEIDSIYNATTDCSLNHQIIVDWFFPQLFAGSATFSANFTLTAPNTRSCNNTGQLFYFYLFSFVDNFTLNMKWNQWIFSAILLLFGWFCIELIALLRYVVDIDFVVVVIIIFVYVYVVLLCFPR